MTLLRYPGAFEAHVTVTPLPRDAVPRFLARCAALGVKPVLIELPRGARESQPMTASYHRGDLRDALEAARRLGAQLQAAGFPVARVKLEAMVRNQGVPRTDPEALGLPGENYFEYHGKLRLPRGDDVALALARSRCAAHGAHLSRNSRPRQGTDGAFEERFVTARYPQVGLAQAEERFRALQGALAAAGTPLFHRLREYTVYDSDAALDQGWMEEAP